MQTKGPNPITYLSRQTALPIIQLYFEFNQLKQLYRQGWLRRGLPPERCESVAEHCFSMAILALFIAETHFPELDLLKVMRLTLVHDCGEIYAGDFTPAAPITPSEKHRLEEEAVVQVLSKLPQGEAYIALWHEFEVGGSLEARFVRQIDRLEFRLQASVYEHGGLIPPNEIFAMVQETLTLPELQEIFMAIETLRNQ
jgi:putative hydrolase of HD superfamily